MGMMATLKDEPPDVKCIRCVPEAWVTPSKKAPFKVWDDTGAGGGKPGSIWVINSMDMVAIVAGHEPPQENFYDLNSNRFFVVEDKHPINLYNVNKDRHRCWRVRVWGFFVLFLPRALLVHWWGGKRSGWDAWVW
jgi:hypothetical protein